MDLFRQIKRFVSLHNYSRGQLKWIKLSHITKIILLCQTQKEEKHLHVTQAQKTEGQINSKILYIFIYFSNSTIQGRGITPNNEYQTNVNGTLNNKIFR